MTTRNVFGTILRSDDTPWPNFRVQIQRGPWSYSASGIYPADVIDFETDDNGEFAQDLLCTSDLIVPTIYACFLKGEWFMFPLQPGDPINIVDLLNPTPGGALSSDDTLLAWAAGDDYETLVPTYDATYVNTISSATIKWPDGSAGVFTATDINATYESIDAYTITHAASGKTVTQAAVTRDSEGRVTNKPALTVSGP